ncbi:MAG: RagB/SusD family nutrient uptake outer membrane protein, partial [Bacteroidota bacterium]
DNFKRISKAAVHTMLAKLHLMRGVWSEALAAADAVLSGDFQLVDNYMDLFDGSLSTEAIWQLDFNSNDGNQLAFHYNPSPAGRHEAGPSQLIVDAFATNDARRASIAATPNSANGAWQVTKYSDAATGSDQPILLRLADVLLIKAEALAELSRFDEATVLFNLVRERSVPGEPISLSANNFKNVILNERMLELAWEGGNRWLDMLRTSLGADYLRSKGRDVCKLKWPIPRIEVNTNTALEQGGCY